MNTVHHISGTSDEYRLWCFSFQNQLISFTATLAPAKKFFTRQAQLVYRLFFLFIFTTASVRVLLSLYRNISRINMPMFTVADQPKTNRHWPNTNINECYQPTCTVADTGDDKLTLIESIYQWEILVRVFWFPTYSKYARTHTEACWNL